MIRRLILTAGLGLALGPAASAGILPGVVSRAADGANTRFSYAVVLPTDTQLKAGNYFTIYDFDGYVPGSATGPDGWSFSLSNVGPTPEVTDPVDNADVLNLSWMYTGGGQVGPARPGDFSAVSTYWDATPSYFTARNFTLSGRVDTNITTTLVPVGPQSPTGPTVPEPGTLLLAAAGLPLAGLVGRRRTRR